MTKLIDPQNLTKKDFETDQDVRWCPGCGDYSILANVQKVMPEFGILPDNVVWVSGIGCSSRFPYYMNTYGFHTIHGRAPAFATGIKVANPSLSVWMATGDGDGLSIGGNHLMHVLRRNVDIKILMFNNRIYGLTKGQYSPTSEIGKVTKSSPLGSADQPVDPASFAFGANGSFISRAIDTDAKGLSDVLRRMATHAGTAFCEVYQNCNVFNDGAFDAFRGKGSEETQIHVRHGQPLRFGKDGQKGLRLNPRRLALEVVEIGQTDDAGHVVTEADILVHDETNRALGVLLASLPFGPFPVVLGVLFAELRPTYDGVIGEQTQAASARKADLTKLLRGGSTWKVEG
jgi:2-oxoglutarate/2-oxoacid ferredoxin oxidoreductase subunit beta